jgi:hypothetical protein
MRRGFNFRAVVQNRIGSVIRFAITSSVAFSTATCSNWLNYQNYWNRTIFRTQTVDFNILSHTLPTKLSYALQQKKPQELQRTLNSNYGLFGLVITDCKTKEKECPNQRFWYSSKSEKNWKKQLRKENLSQHPYDLLQNPLPLYTESEYDSPRAKKQSATGKNNAGDIIGRVYYIRGVPPSFLEDYRHWIQNPLSTSESHKYYCLTTVLFLLGGCTSFVVLEFIIYRKRKQEENVQQQLRIIRHQLNEQERQNNILQAESQQLNEALKNKTIELNRRNEELFFLETRIADLEEEKTQNDDTIAQLETQLAKAHGQRESYTNKITELEAQLVQAKQELDDDTIAELEAQLAELELKIKLDDDTIAQLKAQLVQVESKRKLDDDRIAQLEIKLDEVKQEKEIFTEEYTNLKSQLAEVDTQRKTAEYIANKLENDLKSKTQEQSSQIELLEKQLTEERQIQERCNFTIIQLRNRLQNYTIQDSLNNIFEEEIKVYIDEIVYQRWLNCRVLTSFDVASGRQASQIVDLIIILNSHCVVAIEAKSYTGKIKTDGNPRNNEWFCHPPQNRKRSVKSASFLNPYCQVCTYAQSISQRLAAYTLDTFYPIKVYGVIVFPQQANISNIEGELGKHYEITTLYKLEGLLQKIEEKNNSSPITEGRLLSTNQIEDVLRGRFR